eukprot:c53825_g1_i1 orf=185-370(+)
MILPPLYIALLEFNEGLLGRVQCFVTFEGQKFLFEQNFVCTRIIEGDRSAMPCHSSTFYPL